MSCHIVILYSVILPFNFYFGLNIILLGCTQFDGAHTGTRTAEKLEEILKQYGIMEKTCFAQTDSANTMIKGMVV